MFAGAGRIVQCAWLVKDFDAALELWIGRGAGPFFVARRLVLDLDYRGQPTQLDLSVAWGQQDGVQVELIQQHNDAASAFHDLYPQDVMEGAGSLHHIGMLNEDYDKAMASCLELGFAPATSGCFDGTRFAHMDARPDYGFMIELTEATPGILDFYKMVEDAARNWDGRDPVRPL